MLRESIRKVILFWNMRFKCKLFFILSILLCGLARACILTLPLRRLAPYFGQFAKTSTFSVLINQQQTRQAVFIRRFVSLAAKYTPWNSNCLTQAMVAKFWCGLFKIPYVFYIGFAKSPTDVSGYKGHAWVTAGPILLTGGNGFLEYKVVSTYTVRTACLASVKLAGSSI